MTNRFIRFPYPFLLAIAVLVCACNGLDDDYSTNPNHRLAFSVDTLSFDTIFTTVGTATKQFMIYNHNNEPLDITSIQLASSGKTGFRINVDGRKGTEFNHVEIREKDSLYVLIEVTIDPNGANQPLLLQDSVVFATNSNRQSVLLQAYGQDANLYKGGVVISADTTLTAVRPHLVYDSIVVSPGVTLNIEEGSTFYMHDKARLIVYGTLCAKGSVASPVVFRGDRLDDALEGVLSYDKSPSQWGGIFFRPESYDNTMDHVIVRNGTTGLIFDQSKPDRLKMKMLNTRVTNIGQSSLDAFDCRIEAVNCEFSNAAQYAVSLLGGEYHFIHCTMTNHITLLPRLPNSVCVRLANSDGTTIYPLSKAIFDNCIIDGNYSAGKKPLNGELSLETAEGGAFDCRFNHCVIKSIGDNSTRFTEVLFTTKSPSYRMLGKEKNKYTFDFRPDSLTSLGVGKADASISALYPTDFYGVGRLAGEGPDIGAYEFVPEEEK